MIIKNVKRILRQLHIRWNFYSVNRAVERLSRKCGGVS